MKSLLQASKGVNTLAPQQKARIAFQRFGLGPKPGGPQAMGFGPNSARDACLAELERPADALINDGSLPSYKDACAALLLPGNVDKVKDPSAVSAFEQADIYMKRELRARFNKHMEPPVGYVERLVLFWSNHFSISMGKNTTTRATIGHLERTAIRPNVLGTFADMITAVYQHPAMITYLDNQLSFGGNSLIGKSPNTQVSYNENLARECLELHTLGSGAGYTQNDILNVSKVLTGWSWVSLTQANNNTWGGTLGNAGQFIYREDGHEPGDFDVMGKKFLPVAAGRSGQEQGFELLRWLAVHPSTAQNVSFKLIQHFVTDNPPKAKVDALAKVYLDSGGNLKSMAAALINMDAAWLTPMRRIKTPYVWLVGALRAIGGATVTDTNLPFLTSILSNLNHTPWGYLTPDGYPDEDYAWMNPDALRVREESANYFPTKFTTTVGTPVELAKTLFPGVMSRVASNGVLVWSDYQRAMAVLLMTPEFLRR